MRGTEKIYIDNSVNEPVFLTYREVSKYVFHYHKHFSFEVAKFQKLHRIKKCYHYHSIKKLIIEICIAVSIQKTVELLRYLHATLVPGCSGFQDQFSLSDVQQVYSTLEAITRYQPYLSLEAIVSN